MGRKLDMWRAADRTAHDAEMHIRTFGRRYAHMLAAEESDRASALRAAADRLLDKAMQELSREVDKAVEHPDGASRSSRVKRRAAQS